MERKVALALGEYYHIYNRGVEKRRVFLDKNDYERFERMLYLANSTQPIVFKSVQGLSLDEIPIGERLVAIGAYVLMPNHFHILAKEITPGGISIFMGKLQTGYAMYFNKKNERVGPLFQGTFKTEHVNRDEHLQYLFAYIHLNPVKLIDPYWKQNGIADVDTTRKHLQSYIYSSYKEYVGTESAEASVLSKEEFPEYFSAVRDFSDFMDEWIEIKHYLNEDEQIQG